MSNRFSNLFDKLNRPLIIAEIGTSHNGCIRGAKELIDASIFANADCVKFQYVIADEIVSKYAGLIDLPSGKVDIYKSFKDLEQNFDFYLEIKNYCNKKNIMFLCSPFGVESLKNLQKLGIDTLKIASPEINHFKMLKNIDENIFLIISTGVSKIIDIKNCINFIKNKFALLHCITHYPADIYEYNLNSIPYLKNKFKCPVGVSDHTENYEIIPLLSKFLGASIIEKHITLSNSQTGLDDKFALNPSNFLEMTKILNSDIDIKNYLTEKYNININKILGKREKNLSQFEKLIYKTTNRSLFAIQDIKQGEKFTEENIDLLRAERNTCPGLNATNYPEILSRVSNKFIKSYSPIKKKDILF